MVANLVAEFTQGHLPTPAAVAIFIQDSTARQQLLEHPALVTALVDQATAESGLDCEEVAEQLSAYIDAEHESGHQRDHYQPVRAHLQCCPLCYEDYQLVQAIIAAQQAGSVPRWPLQAHAGIVLGRADLLRSVKECGLSAGSAVQIHSGPVPDLRAVAARIALLRQAADPCADWQLAVALEGAAVAGLRIMLRYETELRVQHTDLDGYTCFPDVPACWLLSETGADLLVLFVSDEPLPDLDTPQPDAG